VGTSNSITRESHSFHLLLLLLLLRRIPTTRPKEGADCVPDDFEVRALGLSDPRMKLDALDLLGLGDGAELGLEVAREDDEVRLAGDLAAGEGQVGGIF